MALHEDMAWLASEIDDWTTERVTAKFGDDSPEARRITRRFKGAATLKEMVGVSRQAIENAEKAGHLPPPEYMDSAGDNPKPIRLGYTIYDIDAMRHHFNTLPWRNYGTNPIVVAIPGGKGGCYKTSTVVHLSQWLSLKGYRVLVIDLDSQAHAGMYFGYHPELNTTVNDTVLPYMLGEEDDLTYCIKPTAWPNLDIIPSHLEMQRLEREMLDADLDYEAHRMLQMGINSVADDYDVILIDGHPDLGLATMNMICASDICLVATSAEINDINSTKQVLNLIKDINAEMDTSHDPIVRIMLTKLGGPKSSSYANERDIKSRLPGWVLNNGVMVTDEVGKGQQRSATIYEQANSKERSTISAWKRALSIYENLFNEILDDYITPLWEEGEEA